MQMENFETTICRFCLDTVSDDTSKLIDEIIREVLNVLLLKLTTGENKCVICNACYAKLFAAFQFKATCMDTEDTIFPYLRAKNLAPVDLRDVYLKERGKEYLRDMLEDERICRLCMQVVTCGFTSVEEVDIGRLRRYIPEVNFDSTKEPVICKACVDSLDTHTNFLNTFWDIKKETNSAIKTLSSIKHEDIEIKSEENYSGTPSKDESTSECRSKCVKTTNDSTLKGKRKPHGSNYENGQVESLARHQRKHKHIPIEQMYICDSCNFRTLYKYSLARHQLTHKVLSKEQMYSCDLCGYKTKYKSNLIQHHQRHEVLSQEQMHKCDLCDYKTNHEVNLIRHQLKHKEDQMHKCDLCDFNTKYKTNLTQHLLINHEYMHKCDSCDFKSKYKSSLTQHQLIHKDIPKEQMYKCELCTYKTIYKQSFTIHQIKHKDVSEVQTYQCNLCDLKTKYKSCLTLHHKRKHEHRSEDQMYKCDLCDYKSGQKANFMLHQRIHEDVPEDQMYKCNSCKYSTKYRHSIAQHLLIHRNIPKEQMFKCDLCDYKTAIKNYLTRHYRKKHRLRRKNVHNKDV